MFAKWWAWCAGDVWGPRFLLPIIPAFAPALAAALKRGRRSSLVHTVVVAGVAMAAIGVVCTVRPALNGYVGTPIKTVTASNFLAKASSPAHAASVDHRMFDWSRFPFGR
jgi:hypothetical protein